MEKITLDWLNDLRDRVLQKQRLLKRVEELEAEMARLKSPSFGGSRGSNENNRTVELAIERAEELWEIYHLATLSVLTDAKRLEKAIKRAKLSPIEQDVMRGRYIDGHSWPELEKALYMSERGLRYVRRRAVEKLNE